MERTATWIAGLAGALFAAGLVLGGMTQPAKVIGFLDVTGDWDPSLVFVLGGAVGIHFLSLRWLRRGRVRPWFGPRFRAPDRVYVDPPLVLGSALFGIGWGLGGFCPGPGITALVSGHPSAVVFVISMVIGMLLHGVVDAAARRSPSRAGS